MDTATEPTDVTEVTEVITEQKLPKNCKENRYYYRHREEILAKRQQKRLEDPEYQAKYELRLQKKAERNEIERQRAEKRELRKKVVEQTMEKAENKKKIKNERISEILNTSALVSSGVK